VFWWGCRETFLVFDFFFFLVLGLVWVCWVGMMLGYVCGVLVAERTSCFWRDALGILEVWMSLQSNRGESRLAGWLAGLGGRCASRVLLVLLNACSLSEERIGDLCCCGVLI
jgi:hypothetical protein